MVFVPYRPIWYYEELGPCVRDWAMIEPGVALCQQAGLPVWIIDRPQFPPWRRRLPPAQALRRIEDLLPRDRIITPKPVSLTAALHSSRRASGPLVTQALTGIATQVDRLLLVDFDPFGQVTPPSRALHWFDEIDDFSKHQRMPRRDRRAFLDKRCGPYDRHTASSLESTADRALPNWVFTPITPTTEPVTGETPPPYAFGYIGYVDTKMDLDLVARLAARGGLGIWGKVLDRGIGRQLAEIPGVALKGAYDATQLQAIMGQFRTGVIPFRPERIHGNSPIKYYQYSAAQKCCLSTSAFGLTRDNLVVLEAAPPAQAERALDQALTDLPPAETVNWARIDHQNNEGRALFETRFAAALQELA